MSTTNAYETEVKLAVRPNFELPDFADLAPAVRACPLEVVRHVAVYYDTPDLRLTRWGVGLRHRTSDGWTLKLAAAAAGPAVMRRELHFPGTEVAPPAAARDLVLALTRGAPLSPAVSLRTLRRRIRLEDDGGRTLFEVTDDHVRVLDGPCAGRRFREVEVEFEEACVPERVDEVLACLRRAGAGPSHRVAKHLRALGLDDGLEPEVSAVDYSRNASLGDALRGIIGAAVVGLVQHDAGVRADGDVHSVHQMRVAVRRLRSYLAGFEPLLEKEWARALGAELKELGAVLGEVRDADVLGGRLRTAAAAIGGAEERAAKILLGGLDAQRERDRVRLLEHLRSSRHLGLIDHLIEAANEPRLVVDASGPAAPQLVPLVRRRWRQLRKQVEGLAESPGEKDLHAVRIAAKHARYACEALAPHGGRPARRFARSLRAVQQVLGEHRDAVVAEAWLRDTGAAATGPVAFAAGFLAAGQACIAADTGRDWREAWRRAHKPSRRRWLRGARSARG